MKSICLLTLSFILSFFFMAQAQSPKKQKRVSPLSPIEEVEGLPHVLIIGDSISIGYTLPTRSTTKRKSEPAPNTDQWWPHYQRGN